MSNMCKAFEVRYSLNLPYMMIIFIHTHILAQSQNKIIIQLLLKSQNFLLSTTFDVILRWYAYNGGLADTATD